MSFSEMSQTRTRAWCLVVIWSLAGAGFFLAFFSGGGAAEFDTDSTRHLLGAAAIGLGFLGQWATVWFTRKRGGAIVADERDTQIVARAGQATLIIVLIAIFSITLVLWTVHEEAGTVHVGWLWFIAYAAVILAVVTHSVIILVLDGAGGGRG